MQATNQLFATTALLSGWRDFALHDTPPLLSFPLAPAPIVYMTATCPHGTTWACRLDEQDADPLAAYYYLRDRCDLAHAQLQPTTPYHLYSYNSSAATSLPEFTAPGTPATVWSVYTGDDESDESGMLRAMTALVPSLRNGVICPCGTEARPLPLASVIMHLNDNRGWSRDRIADWLETLDMDLTLQPASSGD